MQMIPRLIGLLAVVLLATACKFSLPGDEPDPERYKTPIAAAQRSGLDVYWLGKEVLVNGTHWDTIEAAFPIGIGRSDGVAVEVTYLPTGDAPGSMDIRSMSPGEWAVSETGVLAPPSVRVRTEEVSIAGTEALMFTYALESRSPSARGIILDRGDSVVFAYTPSWTGENGREDNPLMDEATFLAVLEQLRPYPE